MKKFILYFFVVCLMSMISLIGFEYIPTTSKLQLTMKFVIVTLIFLPIVFYFKKFMKSME